VLFALALPASTAGGGPAAWAEASADEGEVGEVWVTSQGTHRLFILHGRHGQGGIETVALPSGTGPHLINFSPGGDYAYVSGMGNGDLEILRADDRQIVSTLNFGPSALTHQAKPSPDGSTLLVAQIAAKKLIKVAADEEAESWTKVDELVLPQSPICSIFRDDGERAYVSLLPSGIAIVDVATMSLVKTLATDGFVACGMVKNHNGKSITLASSGGGGHIYRLNTSTDELDQDLGTLGASDWHSFAMSPNEQVGFGTVPHEDEVRVIDLRGGTATTIARLSVDATPGVGNDQTENMGVRGDTLYVSLRASGKLAIVDLNQFHVEYIQLSPPAPFNPANCGPAPGIPGSGCALHGVAIRR
jgi:DNA-binding beta-propeller fold protein YncE